MRVVAHLLVCYKWGAVEGWVPSSQTQPTLGLRRLGMPLLQALTFDTSPPTGKDEAELELMATTLEDILRNGTDSEKAVKRALKRNRASLFATNDRRARFAAAVLGTSVMRRRLFFLLSDHDDSKADADENGEILLTSVNTCRAKDMILAYQIDEAQNIEDDSSLGPTLRLPLDWNPTPVRRKEVEFKVLEGREVIDEWFGTDKDDHSTIAMTATDETESAQLEEARRLAIAFSLPTWLAKSWLLEYGSTGARRLAKASNAPGPISLRRNPMVS